MVRYLWKNMPAKKKHLIKSISLSKIKRYKNNPRTHDEKQIEILVQNIKTNGYINPIIVDKKMVIIAGHGRHQALEIIYDGKDPKINVVVADLTPKEARKQRIADNKISELSKWDEELLSQEIMSIFDKVSRDAIEMDTGFSEKELLGMGDNFQEFFDDGMGDTNKDDDIPNKVKKVTKKGDLWELGNHRVLCGDSTKEKDVKKLMNGKKADISFTSPPYNVGSSIDYKKKNSKYAHSADRKSNYYELLTEYTNNALNNSVYSFNNLCMVANNKTDFIMYLNNYRNKLCDIFIWHKETSLPAMAKNVVNTDHEYIIVLSSKNKVNRTITTGDFRGTISSVYHGKRQHHNKFADIHNATFPVSFVLHYTNGFSKNKNSILDLFLGTGTTLIACEKTNRICYGMELDPHYCDVIRQRYIDFCKANNKKPIVKRNGKIYKL